MTPTLIHESHVIRTSHKVKEKSCTVGKSDGPLTQRRDYQEEAAGVVLFDHLQAVLHHPSGLPQLHGAVGDLITHHLQTHNSTHNEEALRQRKKNIHTERTHT